MPTSHQPSKNGPAAASSFFGSRKNSLFSISSTSSKPLSSASSSSLAGGQPGVDTSPPVELPPRSKSPPNRSTTSSQGSGDFSATLRRSVSLRSLSSTRRTHKPRSPSTTATATFSFPPEPLHNGSAAAAKSGFSFSSFKRSKSDQAETASLFEKPSSTMTAVAYRSQPPGRPPGTAHSNISFQNGGGIGNPSAPTVPMSGPGLLNPQVTYQHIIDTASKRISTLDYLRKAHEGRVYWFNTLLFNKSDLVKLPYFQPQRLARRATNYLLLGFSLPTILDLHSQSPAEYLRALNSLLVEFEQYQGLHPPDGSSGSLSRGRIPQMFKRATNAAGKGRRGSSATESGVGTLMTSTSGDGPLLSSGASTFSTTSTLVNGGGTAPDTLLPTESYQYLLTPSLPFDPDFFETFATLCDVLIDCYTKVTQLISGPELCVGGVGELFAKADARVRKIIVASVVREFEERCREGVRGEVAGVGRVVLGGLM